ncbi:MAG: hypothetical protein QF662_02250 [Phycisphaerae bacterium]|nr:hypothetical protein [Phycisphaerae bacterium]
MSNRVIVSPHEKPNQHRFLVLCYVLGALSWGLGSLLVGVYASRKNREPLAFHAKLASLWNLGVFIVMAFLSVALVCAIVGSMLAERSPDYLLKVALLISYSVYLLNLGLNLIAARRAVRGETFRFPIVAKVLIKHYQQTETEAKIRTEREQVALCYLAGAFSCGMTSLLIWVHARRKGKEYLRLDAKQSFLWHMIAGFFPLFLFSFLVSLGLILVMSLGQYSFEEHTLAYILVANCLMPFILLPLNLGLNFFAILRVLQGRRFLFPVLGKMIFKRSDKVSTR